MAFKITKTTAYSLESPEAMFRDIKTKKIHVPLADQADLWREYQEKALQFSDVAFHLPTGGGKTLVGLVLAEWRRLKFNERVVYLCPTKQLVNQVVEQATIHGLQQPEVVFFMQAFAPSCGLTLDGLMQTTDSG